MNLIWLEDFPALAATGNVSRAAEDRHSSQPAFSRRIRGLEESVGADLFDRRTRPARRTEVGEWFRGVVEELLTRVARVPGDARKVVEASSVVLRIASTRALSFTFLPGWLRGLESGSALGPVQLMSDVLQRCEELMLQSRVQVVLSHAHPKAPGAMDGEACRSAWIGDDVLVAVSQPEERGRPRHRLRGGNDDPAVPVLAYTDESGLGRVVHAVLGCRLERSPVQFVFTAHLASVLRTMTLDGRGLASACPRRWCGTTWARVAWSRQPAPTGTFRWRSGSTAIANSSAARRRPSGGRPPQRPAMAGGRPDAGVRDSPGAETRPYGGQRMRQSLIAPPAPRTVRPARHFPARSARPRAAAARPASA